MDVRERLMAGLKRVKRPEHVVMVSLLFLVAAFGFFLIHNQKSVHHERVRANAAKVALMLSKIPLEQLVPTERSQGAFHWLSASHPRSEFAYHVLVDVRGNILAKVPANVDIPHVPLSKQLVGWLEEQVIEPIHGQPRIREFIAPVLDQGQLAAYVRVGIFDETRGAFMGENALIGVLVLLVLMPVAFWYLQTEQSSRLVAGMSSQITTLVDQGSIKPLPDDEAGQLGRFIDAFNSFVTLSKDQVQDYERQHMDLLASSRVVSYQKSQIEAVLESLPDATILMDDAGTVKYASTKLASVLGTTGEEAQGQRPSEWCRNQELSRFLEGYCGIGDRPSSTDSLTFAPDPSKRRLIRAGAYPLLDRGESAWRGTVVVFSDVTAESIAKEAQDEFVTQVAHELKTPLHTLGMYSESLLDEKELTEEFRIEACNVIHDQVERLSELVNTLLSLARFERQQVCLERQRVRLHEFLRDTLDAVSKGRNRNDLSFALELPTQLGPVSVDKELLRIALNNLLTNAIKYNREGGSVTLAAEETSDNLLIHITDTGIGIPPEDQANIFDKFFRSKRDEVQAIGGHGLGLALARQIVELHGGKVELDSTVGEGTRLTVTFNKAAIAHKEQKA
jgi:two-component system sensor histidine kinase VicK